MTAGRWRTVREILHAASEMDAAARGPYLDQSCGGDAGLRAEVERLLDALEAAGGFLEPPGRETQTPADSRIGPYLVLAEAARGGMGVVYQAVREDDYRQKVALKLVKRELQTGALVARFRQERQALAMLNHPHIARLLDGGTAPDGRPYLVMEWVDGRSITDHCAAASLGVRRRLELFLDVCEAVAHAHRNLVVHRDLKPSNILITPEGRPKLLDFGIAKILTPLPEEAPATMTMSGALVLTPDYASPEQVRGEPVTTATDVYSLGAVLYELVAGSRPHRLETRTPTEIERVVCTQEVARPSRAAGAPGVRPAELRGDLDNIVLKALEKDAARRYATVEEFAGDVRRYLEGRPVVARPGSLWYHVSKFARRNRVLVGAAAAVLLALAVGLALALWEARAARLEREVAERRFELARRVAGSLLFEIHDGIADLAGATRARELLLARSLQYLDALSKEADASPALQRDLAAGYERAAALEGVPSISNLGRPGAARASLDKALALRQKVLAANPRSVTYRRELAATHREYVKLGGDGREMLRHAEAALAITEKLEREYPRDAALAADRARTEHGVGRSLNALERYREAVPHFRAALAYEPSPSSENAALYHKSLGSVLVVTGDLAGALQEYRAAAALDEAAVRAAPANARARMDLSFDYSDWGLILGRVRRYAEAVQKYRQADAIRAAMVAADPRDARAAVGLVSVRWRLAWALADDGKRAASEAAFRQSVALAESLTRTLPDRRVGAAALAEACWKFGQYYKERRSSCPLARPWLERARGLYRELHRPADLTEQALAGCAARR